MAQNENAICENTTFLVIFLVKNDGFLEEKVTHASHRECQLHFTFYFSDQDVDAGEDSNGKVLISRRRRQLFGND